MYNQFFGFTERPFRLVPDPAYLFLSGRHEEALAYLKYAVSEGEGFVEITGEVGTGKTLLCRTFLEQLDDNVASAYIFNPRLSARELIKAVNDEFGVAAKDGDGIKDHIDALNAFLMQKKAEGKKVVLVIDEAQNLDADVLEQVRLLSNLETTRSKLIQIILAGQPELGEMLDSHELRQLGQRITLSCRLRPLTLKETGDYIRHRIQVASRKTSDIFTRSAIKKIYRYSGGIPRLINIACDRALLCAYGFNQHKVSAVIATAAIAELASRGEVHRRGAWAFSPGRSRRLGLLLGLLLVLALLVMVFFFQSDIRILVAGWTALGKQAKHLELPIPNSNTESPASIPHETTLDAEIAGSHQQSASPGNKAVEGESIADAPITISHDVVSLVDYLAAVPADGSRNRAMQTVLIQWDLDPAAGSDIIELLDDAAFFAASAAVSGLSVHRISADLDLLRGLNLCAILAFDDPGNQGLVYLAAVGAGDHIITLEDGFSGFRIMTPDEEISRHKPKEIYAFWKNFYNYQGIIPFTGSGDAVITLKLHLRDLGHGHIQIGPDYDMATRRVVERLQAKYGIPVDGVVGPLTKMALYNETPGLAMPRLRDVLSADKDRPEADAAIAKPTMETGS